MLIVVLFKDPPADAVQLYVEFGSALLEAFKVTVGVLQLVVNDVAVKLKVGITVLEITVAVYELVHPLMLSVIVTT